MLKLLVFDFDETITILHTFQRTQRAKCVKVDDQGHITYDFSCSSETDEDIRKNLRNPDRTRQLIVEFIARGGKVAIATFHDNAVYVKRCLTLLLGAELAEKILISIDIYNQANKVLQLNELTMLKAQCQKDETCLVDDNRGNTIDAVKKGYQAIFADTADVEGNYLSKLEAKIEWVPYPEYEYSQSDDEVFAVCHPVANDDEEEFATYRPSSCTM